MRCSCLVVGQLLAGVAVGIAGLTAVEAQDASPLTLEQIMADPDWIARSPETPRWSHDGESIFYQRKRKGVDVRDWFRVSPETGKSEKVPLEELSEAIPASGDFSRDQKRLAFSRDGDLFVLEIENGKRRQLTRTSATESSPEFLKDEQRIQFRRDGTLLIRNLKTGFESEPVVLKFEDAPPDEGDESRSDDKKDDDDKGFVVEQEHDLFEFLRREEALREASKKQDRLEDEANTANLDRPIHLGKGHAEVSRTLSSNARWLAVVVKPAGGKADGQPDQMPVWIRDEGYVENRRVRSLVGDEPEPPNELKLIDLKTREVVSVDLQVLPEIATDRLAWLKQISEDKVAGEAASDASFDNEAKKDETEQKPRPVEINTVRFSADSSQLLFQCYSTDNKDRWIVRLDVSEADDSESLEVVHHRFDEAWIGQHDYATGWVGESNSIWFVSEASGYAHLFVAEPSSDARQLTDGALEVSDVTVSHDESAIRFTSNEGHPGIYELWSVDLESGDRKQLTDLGGVNEFRMSPDESAVIARHSTALRPPELVLVRLDADENPKPLTRTVTKEFRSIDWALPQFVEVPSRAGGVIHSRLYLPDSGAAGDDDAATSRPAVLFVHGAGYLQNAHQGWSSYFREFMFHTLLTRRGFVVLDMDYRASEGYGRDWRTAIYRQMGTPEVEDLADGVEWLAEHHGVDPKRVGVYGGSYGGFLTLMALFREPDLFACGAALRPVTDWAHYNHGYTSNILNTPDTDPEAYRNSSPILFAEGLTQPLLICHGMIDDNVFFKDSVRLAQKLIELKKDNWSVAMYPVEAHGFRQPSSWRDEYQRILDLFERELLIDGN